MRRYEWVDHPSDIGFRAYGKRMEEAFENAALAFTDIIADPEKITPRKQSSVEIESEDLEALLFDWLNHLLYMFDAKDQLYSKFDVEELSEKEEGFSLKATFWGEDYDPGKHGHGTEVKAITYHLMEIDKREEDFSVQVIVDI